MEWLVGYVHALPIWCDSVLLCDILPFFIWKYRLIITIFFHFFFAAFGPILIFILKIIDSTLEVGIILRWVFKIVPSFCLTDTILYDSSKTRLFLIRPQLKKDSDFDMTLLRGNILFLCMHFVIWIFMLLLIENGFFNCFGRIINVLRKNKIAPKK